MSQLSLFNRRITTLHTGEPEPVNIIVGQDNDLYWTCKSAGVILTQDDEGETSVFLDGLQKPSGIATDCCGNIYFTQAPTPGVNGMTGGSNSVVFAIGTATVVLSMGEPEPADIVVPRTATPIGRVALRASFWNARQRTGRHACCPLKDFRNPSASPSIIRGATSTSRKPPRPASAE